MPRQEEVEAQENGVNEYGDGVAWVRGSLIGKGGFGCVYLATPKNPRSKYSCLPPVIAVKSAEVSVSGSIQKEREILSNLKGCPHIIRCLGEETTMGNKGVMVYNLLLEYGSGGTLADRLKKSGCNGLPELEARAYARSILRGLNHIHGCGYAHCDLKPDNILLVGDDVREGVTEFRAKIGDFGLAKREKQSKKRKLEPYWRGTPMYLSPEAVINNVQEAPCDIWALGCLVLEMLTGNPPWDGNDELRAEDILRKIGSGHELPEIPNELSKEARDFLRGCLVRKSMYRLTSDMLLNHHPFVEDLGDNDAAEEMEAAKDLNEIESIPLVFESDDEYGSGFSPEELADASEECLFSDWSEEEDENDLDDELVSDSAEEEELEAEEVEGVTGSNVDSGSNPSHEISKQISSQPFQLQQSGKVFG